MKTKLAMSVILMMAMSTPALAHGNSWGKWSDWNNRDWSGLFDNLKDQLQEIKNKDWDKLKDVDCDWGRHNRCDDNEDEGRNWGNHWGNKRGKCDPPSSVPSPTAALAGLGAMGLMLTRRRNKRA